MKDVMDFLKDLYLNMAAIGMLLAPLAVIAYIYIYIKMYIDEKRKQ